MIDSNAGKADEIIVLGRIIAPLGLKGWVKIQAYGDDPEDWEAMQEWWLATDNSPQPYDWHAVSVAESEMRPAGLVARFVGVDDRTGSEALIGKLVGAPRSALPAVDKNEFYWADLIGLSVVNTTGYELGEVTELITTGAHEVLCVQDAQGQKRLLPFVASIVKDVDTKTRRIEVDWSELW